MYVERCPRTVTSSCSSQDGCTLTSCVRRRQQEVESVITWPFKDGLKGQSLSLKPKTSRTPLENGESSAPGAAPSDCLLSNLDPELTQLLSLGNASHATGSSIRSSTIILYPYVRWKSCDPASNLSSCYPLFAELAFKRCYGFGNQRRSENWEDSGTMSWSHHKLAHTFKLAKADVCWFL